MVLITHHVTCHHGNFINDCDSCIIQYCDNCVWFKKKKQLPICKNLKHCVYCGSNNLDNCNPREVIHIFQEAYKVKGYF